MMLILAMDTSSPCGSLALLRDATILTQWQMSSDEPYSASLLRDSKRLLDASSICFEEIDLFSVNAGPGSFTGLRVGLTTVKGWAEAWGRPVAPVSGLEAVAIQVSHTLAPGSPIAAVMDARRGQVFGAFFRRSQDVTGGLEPFGNDVLSSADEFLDSAPAQLANASGLVVACTQRELIEPALKSQGLNLRIEVVSPILAPFIGQLGYARAVRGNTVDALHLDANYIRRSDAEMNWKAG